MQWFSLKKELFIKLRPIGGLCALYIFLKVTAAVHLRDILMTVHYTEVRRGWIAAETKVAGPLEVNDSDGNALDRELLNYESSLSSNGPSGPSLGLEVHSWYFCQAAVPCRCSENKEVR